MKSSEEPNINPWVDPKEEARVVAVLTGEASDFERAALERLMKAKPELRASYRCLEEVHDLLREACARSQDPEGAWKLDPERRAALLASMRRHPDKGTAGSGARRWRRFLLTAGSVAAMLMMSLAALHMVGMSADPAVSTPSLGFSSSSGIAPEGMNSESRPSLAYSITDDKEDRLQGSERSLQLAETSRPARRSDMSRGLGEIAEGHGQSGDGEQAAVEWLFAGGEAGERPGPELSFESIPPSTDGLAATQTDLRAGPFAGGGSNKSLRSEPAGAVASVEPSADHDTDFSRSDADRFGQISGINMLGSAWQQQQGGQAMGEAEAPAVEAAKVADSKQPSVFFDTGGTPANAPHDFSRAGGVVADRLGEEQSVLARNADTNDAAEPEGMPHKAESEIAEIVVDPAVEHDQPVAENGRLRMARAGDLLPKLATPENEVTPETGPAALDDHLAAMPAQGQGGVESAMIEEALADLQGPQAGLEDARSNQRLESLRRKADAYEKGSAPAVYAPERPRIEPVAEEQNAEQTPFSTFSLHVSDVAFKLAKAALLENGTQPEAEKMRVEEFVNAFDYGDRVPTYDEQVACRIEQAAHPFLQQRNLLRVSMRTAALGRSSAQPLQLTLLLDNSGSMEREDRKASVLQAVALLAQQLTARDRVNLISFARQPQLRVEGLSGDRAAELVEAVARTPVEGGTNLELALQLGGELARRHYISGGQNRVVILTDGAANLGDADPERLRALTRHLRESGIAVDACGVGANGLNDRMLEALTREADGRYYFLDRPEDADASFVQQVAGALRPAARNVKVQVRFNPERVGRYRLLGFEKHRLAKEDFRNDAVDAAEMAGAEAGVALYQVEVKPEGEGPLGEVFVRYQETASGRMVERRWEIPHEEKVTAFAEAAPSLQLAGVAAFVGQKLKGGPAADQVRLGEMSGVLANLRQVYGQDPRVKDLVAMAEKLR